MLLSLIFFALSIPLYFGKGSFLIAGYNTAANKEKAKYDEKKLCRIMAVLLDVIGILLIIRSCGWFNDTEVTIFAVAIAVAAVILSNTITIKK